MKKRIFAALMLLTLLLPLGIPGSVQAAEEESLESIIQEQIEEYAATLYSDTTPVAGKNVLLRHAIFGGGRDLIEDEDSPITAALMNSDILQECLVQGIAGLVESMHSRNLTQICALGHSAWYDRGCSYSLSSYLTSGDVITSYLEYNYVDSMANYGGSMIPIPKNPCDRELVYVVGTCRVIIELKRVKTQSNTMTYFAEVTVEDTFDFDGNVDDEANGPLADAMHGIAGDLAMMLYKPYSWSCIASFELQIPYNCDHRFENYQWILVETSGRMHSVVSEVFSSNETRMIHHSVSNPTKYYYNLQNTVTLHHGDNWMIEYQGQGLAKFTLGNSPENKSSEICFVHYESTECTEQNYESSGIFFGYWGDRIDAGGNVKEQVYYRYGVQLDHIFQKRELYTYRCENIVAEDGSNMVYLSIFDSKGGQILAPTAMNRFFMTEAGWLKDQNCSDNWLSGKDMQISYIGNSTRTIFPEYFSLRIRTKGEDVQDSATYGWMLDEKSMELVSSVNDAYTENRAFPYDKNGEGFYYALERAVVLRHNKPWVLEYDARSNANFSMGNATSNGSKSLYFRHEHFQGMYLARWDAVENENGVITEQKFYRYGSKLQEILNTTQRYTFRYENILSEDGSNMVHLSILDAGGQEVFAAPLNRLFTVEPMENGWGMIDQNEFSDWISGKDIRISYIGNAGSYRFSKDFQLRIWPGGEDSQLRNAMSYEHIQPTCADPGGEGWLCALCGYYELTQPVEPLGHRFGEYISNQDADCVNDGTKTAECVVCGVEDTVVDEGSVYGHEFRKYKSDGNATCTSDGTKSAKCKYCDVTDTVPDPGTMQPHAYEAAITPPTCTERGYTTHTCVCGDSYMDSYTDELGHDLGVWETIKEPDYLENGLKERHCSRCEAYETEEIPNNPFPDVTNNSFKDYILWCSYEGIISGDRQGNFNPTSTVTRGQFIIMLWRAAGKPEPTQFQAFPDVTENSSFYKAVCWAVEKGITNGQKNGKFGVNDPCTRGHVALFLYRYAGKPEPTQRKSFPDVTGGTYYDAVCWALEEGITSGQNDGLFGVSNPCQRRHVAKFLFLYLMPTRD